MSTSTPPPGGTGDGPGDQSGDQASQPPPGGTAGQEPAWQEPAAGASEPGGQPEGRERAPAGLQPSSVGKRIGAAAIDFIGLWIIFAVVFIPIVFALAVSDAMSGGRMMGVGGGFGIGWVISLVGYALMLGYFVFLEGSRGQTVGKMLLNMKVYEYDGSPMDYEGAFKRRFWFFIGPIIPIPVLNGLVGIGILVWLLVTMNNDQLNRGYHDVFGDSIVVDTQ